MPGLTNAPRPFIPCSHNTIQDDDCTTSSISGGISAITSDEDESEEAALARSLFAAWRRIAFAAASQRFAAPRPSAFAAAALQPADGFARGPWYLISEEEIAAAAAQAAAARPLHAPRRRHQETFNTNRVHTWLHRRGYTGAADVAVNASSGYLWPVTTQRVPLLRWRGGRIYIPAFDDMADAAAAVFLAEQQRAVAAAAVAAAPAAADAQAVEVEEAAAAEAEEGAEEAAAAVEVEVPAMRRRQAAVSDAEECCAFGCPVFCCL